MWRPVLFVQVLPWQPAHLSLSQTSIHRDVEMTHCQPGDSATVCVVHVRYIYDKPQQLNGTYKMHCAKTGLIKVFAIHGYTRKRISQWGPTNASFGMTPTLQ